MGAADIINPNGGISAVTGKSAYVGPDPDIVTHIYGAAALLQSGASVWYYWRNSYFTDLVKSEYQTYLVGFIVMQVAWTPVALTWLVYLLNQSSASLYAAYYFSVLLSVDGPVLGYFLVDYLYLKSYLAGFTFGPKPRPSLQLSLNLSQLVLI